jgi:hypothetical protein
VAALIDVEVCTHSARCKCAFSHANKCVCNQEIACGLKGALHVTSCVRMAQDDLMKKADHGGSDCNSELQTSSNSHKHQDALRRPAFRQAITSFMFDIDKGWYLSN